MAAAPKANGERATERVAVLMTPAEKTAFTEQASSMGLSLGQFFREAGSAYAAGDSDRKVDDEALEAALKQLELSTARTEAALDDALAEVRSALRREQTPQQQR
jgi:hypothetical protein